MGKYVGKKEISGLYSFHRQWNLFIDKFKGICAILVFRFICLIYWFFYNLFSNIFSIRFYSRYSSIDNTLLFISYSIQINYSIGKFILQNSLAALIIEPRLIYFWKLTINHWPIFQLYLLWSHIKYSFRIFPLNLNCDRNS